jgi:hypothetical protein
MGMEPVVTEGQIVRQPPEAQAIIRVLLARIAALEGELRELRGQVQGKTPQNSSLPPVRSIRTPSPGGRSGSPKDDTAGSRAIRNMSGR